MRLRLFALLAFALHIITLNVCAQSPNAQTQSAQTQSAQTQNAQTQNAQTQNAQTQVLDARNASLLAFKREQVALWQGEIERYGQYAPTSWSKALRQTRERAEQIQRTQGDAASVPWSLFQERAYFASNDGSAQPYYVALPFNYTPTKKYPLIVFLHGYSTDISKINPWLPAAETVQSAQRRGFILAMPYGRRNSDFVQWGQDDVLRVRAECLRLFSVDQQRVFLLGASMGGYGAYTMGFHSIGQWAAIAAISGRTDFYLWFDIKRADLPPWKRVLFDADDPRTLEFNARNTPVLVQHGALDGIVPVEHSRRIAADARLLGLPLRYDEDPYGSHFGDFGFNALERAFDWFEKRAPAATPRALTLVAGDLREARESWASIEAFTDYAQIARLDARLMADRIVVKTDNVARFKLELPPALQPKLQPTNVTPNAATPNAATPNAATPNAATPTGATWLLEVNGAIAGQFAPDAPIAWDAPDAKTGKTPQRTGPFKSLMRDPFLLVYGDGADKLAATNFAARWKSWADGEATLKSAGDITARDQADFNLILFGTRATNPLINQIADRLPLELTPDGYRISDKIVAAQNVGLRLVYASPWNAARLIGVCSGENWGAGLPLNHVWDLVPDYIVYDYRTEADGTNKPLEAGFFDGNWALPK